MIRSSLFSLATLALLAAPCFAQAPQVPSEIEISAENCVVQYINKVDVPAKAEGTLVELHFEEGTTVDADTVLAVIDDTAAKLNLDLKKAEEKEAVLNAANDVNLKDAINSEKLAVAEAESYKNLYRDKAIPYWDMEKKRLEAERMKLRIDLAKIQKKIAEAQMIAKFSEVKLADFELTRRKVTAPMTGFIESRIVQLGQWVQPGSPIATLIQMDKLRVEGDINALRYPEPLSKGMPVQVLIYSQGDPEKGLKFDAKRDRSKALSFDAQLGLVSMEIDLNNRRRVWVELPNKKIGDDWQIKPGMRAEIIIRKSGQVF